MMQGCFSNPGSPTSNRSKKNTASTTTSSSSSSKESLITCIYQTRLCDTQINLTLTWSRTPYTHTLTIHAPEYFSTTISLQPSTFSIFRTRPGSKSIQINQTHDQQGQAKEPDKIKVYYDFSRAEYTRPNSAEPGSRFYIGLRCNGKVELFLGDLEDELTRRVNERVNSDESTLLSRREHVFGRRIFETRTEFMGLTRLIEIDCSGGTLKVKFDGEVKVNVKRLAWKFRGNEKMVIDGIAVEFYWDVLNWVDTNNKCNNGMSGQKNGVFVFQVGEGGVWPEMVGPEKKLMRKNSPAAATALSPAGSCSSVCSGQRKAAIVGGVHRVLPQRGRVVVSVVVMVLGFLWFCMHGGGSNFII
ncbi:putative DNA double-strand break repair Rad50 ATPase [Bienertia sinuspersici]